MDKNPVLEVCAADLDSVKAAACGGAARVELCSALSEGGVTPSLGLLRESRQIEGLLIHVLIRPRGGDFIYSPEEIRCMEHDVAAAVANGADGVVIGALLPDGTIDTDTCRRLIDRAGGRNVTFHRAFDLCKNPEQAIETIISLGCNRILTSGQSSSAEAGIPALERYVRLAADRLTILPGGGVGSHNAARIMSLTGCHELHASARHTVSSPMAYRNTSVSMGVPGADEYSRKITSSDIVANIVAEMRKVDNHSVNNKS